VTSQQIDRAAEQIRSAWNVTPRLGLILGTGLGELADQIDCQLEVSYEQLSGFVGSTAPGHRGRIVCGELLGVPLVALAGRIHRYEGYCYEDITQGVRLLNQLGAPGLVISNASGGLNPELASGDVLVISEHIDLMFLDSAGSTEQADRRQLARASCRLESPYDPDWIALALAAAAAGRFSARAGSYLALTGPNYETRAEYRMLRWLGADVVGMSTVPEVAEAARLGMRVLALSAVSNVANPDDPEEVSAEAVIELSRSAQPTMLAIVKALVDSLGAPAA
jgi:purine-nucleoside phosphorylase